MKKILLCLSFFLFICCSNNKPLSGRYYGLINLENYFGYGVINFQEKEIWLEIYEDIFTKENILTTISKKEKKTKNNITPIYFGTEKWFYKVENDKLIFNNEKGYCFILTKEKKKDNDEYENFNSKVRDMFTISDDFFDRYSEQIKTMRCIREEKHEETHDFCKCDNLIDKTCYYENGIIVDYKAYDGSIANISFTQKLPNETLTNIIGISLKQFMKENYFESGYLFEDYCCSFNYDNFYNFCFQTENDIITSVMVSLPL